MTVIPNRSYIQVELELPKNMAGSTEPITTLVLVCPDPQCSDSTPLLVGTNIHEICPLNSVTKPDSEASCMRVYAVAPQAMLRMPTAKVSTTAGDEVAEVKWTGPGPLVIPTVADHIVVCKVCETQPLSRSILVTKYASSPALPLVYLCKPLVLILPNDFGDSQTSAEWKERLSRKLAERSNVFSVDECNIGLAREVEHSIKLHDDKLFQERSCRVVPANLDDLRCHLQGLLVAGIIKESRSPYASPILLTQKKSGQLRMCEH
ncbi:hypothetical protein AOLI_G00126340 [Acnodon oligacanthus]